MDKVSFYRAFHVALAVVCLLLHKPISVSVRTSFYRAFHVALAVVCLLLHKPISVSVRTAKYYEDQYPDGIRYSKLLVVLQIFILVQSGFALEEVLRTFPSSQREREEIPDPELRLLLKHFLSKFFERTMSMLIGACSYLFYVEMLGKDKDGVVKDGILPFLVVFIALTIYQFVSLRYKYTS